MRYFLSHDAVLKWLETPSVYHIARDELYELDHEAFTLLRKCASQNGCAISDHDFLDYCLREGLLITDRVSAKHPPLTESPVPSLRYLELQITDRCNLRCKHCFIEEGSSELSIHHVKRHPAGIRGNAGVKGSHHRWGTPSSQQVERNMRHAS